MNVTATNISVKDGIHAGILFSLGGLFTETVCLCVALAAMDWVRKQQKIFRMFEWFTALLIMALAGASFIAAFKMKAFGNNTFTAYSINPFLLGSLLSALNPLHIPFWIGWTTVLINKNVLQPGKRNYVIYVIGISIGTMAGFDVFIYGGNYIVAQLKENQNILNWIIGVVLLITALVQLYKIIYRQPEKSAVA